MESTAEEQLIAARPTSPPSDQSQYSPSTRGMNWREFFKPEKSKIVLSTSLFLPLFVRFFLTFIEKNYDVQSTLYTVSLDFTWVVMIEEINDIPLMAFILYFLLPNIIIIYILSCLITWVYKKINNTFVVQNLLHANWKEFFKISTIKIILFILLLIFSYILDYLVIFIGIANFGSFVKPDPTLTQRVFGAILEIILDLVSPLRFVFHLYGRYLIILNTIYLYCLACFIVWIFNRVRRKKLNP